MLDTSKLRADFPLLVNQPEFVYLDSGATALKPQVVIDKVIEYYTQYSANIHRGIYKISEKATSEYDKTRRLVTELIGAQTNEIIFTRNTTEGINLVAYSLGRSLVEQGDEIVTTIQEHHSNFVPWQQLAFENGADLKVIDITEDGFLNIYEDEARTQLRLGGLITKKTKLLAITQVSNVLGTVNDLKTIIARAKEINPEIIVVVDAAQAIPYLPVDVTELGCDFLVFSSHKCLGPTGVGILWGKYELLEQMYPFLYGGDMIESVSIEKTTFLKPPQKFEAGTPDIANIIGLSAAIQYLQKIGLNNIRQHEEKLTEYAMKRLKEEFSDTITIFGPPQAKDRGGIISFTFGSIHPHDLAQILDEENIAVRAGHHCAMPLHTRLNIPASVRASFNIYNNENDIEKLILALKRARHIFKI